MRLALRTIMKRPASLSRNSLKDPGRSGTMPETRWLGWKVSVCENQKIESCVRTLPRSGMPLGRTRSKAEMRSVATMSSRLSSSSYVSRTLPRAKSLSGSVVSFRGGPAITAGALGERFGAQVARMLGAAEHRSERTRWCVSEKRKPQRRRRAAWAPKIRRGSPAGIAISLHGCSQSQPFIRDVGVFQTGPRIENGRQHRADTLHHVTVLFQHLAEAHGAWLHRLHRRLLHDEVGVLAGHPAFDEGQQHPLREDDPARKLQVGKHAIRTHLEPPQDLVHLQRHVVDGGACVGKDDALRRR